MTIRELFSQKLEKAEVIPDPEVSSKLMNKLARKEFLRFNPRRVNIYYLAGTLIAGITVGIILSSVKENSDQLTPIYIPNVFINVPVEQNILQKTEKSNEYVSGLEKTKVIKSQKGELKTESGQQVEPRQNIFVNPAIVNNSLSEKLLTDTSGDKNKLQSTFRQDVDIFEISAKEGCAPLKLRFSNKLNSSDSCRWTFGDGGYSSEKNPEWIFDVEGEYKVVLNVFDSKGLKATSSSVVTVYPKPKARFEIVPEKAVLPKDEIRFYNYSTNALHYKWYFGDGNTSDLFEPRYRYSTFGNFNIQLVVSSEYGCTDSLVVLNAFSDSEYSIEFPNAFIPNQEGPTDGFFSSKSDEVAQVFHPVSSGVSDYQLKIFSKLGILIFESSDINIGWDGYFKGQLANPGVYIWKVRGSFINGEPFIKMGDVTLLKTIN